MTDTTVKEGIPMTDRPKPYDPSEKFDDVLTLAIHYDQRRRQNDDVRLSRTRSTNSRDGCYTSIPLDSG